MSVLAHALHTCKVRFDFPLLLFEVLRHALSCAPFEHWLFVDTLDVLRGVGGKSCLKLQCLVREMAEASDLRAHRALDDEGVFETKTTLSPHLYILFIL